MATEPTSGPCRVCRHRSSTSCPGCGGMLGVPHLGLPPCPVCPHGRHIASDIDDANAEMNEQYVVAQEQTVFAGFEPEVYVFDYDGFATGEVVNPDTLEAIALSNQMRIMQINNMLQSNPERIPAVEAVLGISGYMGS
jgi:hypothetical protein